MDPERVRAYLQVACAGLGFDIGEIWWTSNDHGSSTVAAIEEKKGNNYAGKSRPRFVQLYTSKSYSDRRSMLVNPPEPVEEDAEDENGENSTVGVNGKMIPKEENSDLEKHVLSPLLVDAISRTSQVVWANTKKQEGLLGRSDIRLHTAVGMPVAVDNNGNMCVVVMFSPNNIQSTDDAMEYLQCISHSATSSSIPTLMPAFDPKVGLHALPHIDPKNQVIPLLASPSLTDGVTTRFVPLDDNPGRGPRFPFSVPEVHSDHDLAAAPKDCFGIPMLPSFAELGGPNSNSRQNDTGSPVSDAFDEASYGVWSTIMDTPTNNNSTLLEYSESPTEHSPDIVANIGTTPTTPIVLAHGSSSAGNTLAMPPGKARLGEHRKERLEEFASAFLGVSVFDMADVWVPLGGTADCLGHGMSVLSDQGNKALNEFSKYSETAAIRYWSGAIGRAFSSGNPVWSANPDVFIDEGRRELFGRVKFQTALAVPVFSGKSISPACVLCCYSFVRTSSVPFVLRFVQQAVRLLWEGLDQVEPHESLGKDLWKDVAPADLGEMAADVEMQQHFLSKKRPRDAISNNNGNNKIYDDTFDLARQLNSLDSISGVPSTNSIYTGSHIPSSPTGDRDESGTPTFGASSSQYIEEINSPSTDANTNTADTPQTSQVYNNSTVRNHVHDAIVSATNVIPFPVIHSHISTNREGSKRAHVVSHSVGPQNSAQTILIAAPSQYEATSSSTSATVGLNSNRLSQHQQALAMTRPLPLPTQILRKPNVQSQSRPIQQHEYHNQQQQYQQEQQQPQQYQQQPQQQQQYQQEQPQQYHNQQQQQQQYQQPQQQHNYQDVQQSQFVSQHNPSGSQQQQQQRYQMANQHAANNVQQQPISSVSDVQSNFVQFHPGTSEAHIASEESGLGFHSMSDHQLFGMEIPDPTPVHFAPAAAAAVSSVPTERISATGITFAHVQAMSAASTPQNGDTMNNSTTNPVIMSASVPFCVAADGSNVAMMNMPVSGKPCRIQGCNEPSVARRPYCVKHSGNRLCEHDGCNKCAQGSTRFCIAHGGGRRCTFPGCDKGARDKFFCAAHGGGKRCKFDGCSKSAVGGSNLCTAHGGGRRCVVEGCDKSAQSSTKFCVKHGGGKKCSHPGCEKVARGRTQFCAAHGGGVRCKLAGCNRVAIGKLQLCRAHGGGVRARSKNSAGGDDMSNS